MASSLVGKRAKSEALFQLDGWIDGSAFTALDVLNELLSAEQQIPEQAQLTNDAEQVQPLALSPSGEVNLERFAQLLAMRGHHVWLRTGRLESCSGHVALRHTFVLAGVPGCSASSPTAADTPEDSMMPQLFVVDPCFKEQFQLPNATPEYSALFQELPDLFVGTAEQLVPVVELMCTQMQQVFADTATSCPPWRTPSCMLTKWLPSTADDVPVVAPGSSNGDSSSSGTSGSTPSSALSSPAGLRPPMLPPISTVGGRYHTGGAGADADGPPGRSPLYFDQEKPAARAFLVPSSPDDLEDEAGQHGFCPADARQASLFVHWAAEEDDAAAAPGGGRAVNGTSFMGTGSWGMFGSTVSSPGVDIMWGSALRACHSEDGSGPGAHARARGVAIAPRPNSRADQGNAGDGFANALTAQRPDISLQVWELSSDAPPPLLRSCLSATAAAGGAPHGGISAGRPAGGISAMFGAYRSYGTAGNPTLDISRFDRNSMDDVLPAGPLAWGGLGGGADHLSSTSSIAPGGKLGGSSSGSKPPPLRRRSTTSSTSSQCSALSAAIAGKGVPMR